MKSKLKPLEEVRDKYYPLIGSGSRDNLPLSRKPVVDFRSQVSTTRKTAIANMDINGAPSMWCATAI